MNQEATSTIPTLVTKLFIEADAAELYTRPIFYKGQQEIIASCYDIRIQAIGPLVDGIKIYEMQEVRIKGKLFEVIFKIFLFLCVNNDVKMMPYCLEIYSDFLFVY